MKTLFFILLTTLTTSASEKVLPTPHGLTPRQVIEEVVRANAALDYEGMARFMAKDDDIISYTIGGRKYVGWKELEQDLKEEFKVLEKVDIPILELKVTVYEGKGLARFSMEIDYNRYVGSGDKQVKNFLPLRETGFLEKRNGEWILVSWHESQREMTGSNQDKKANGQYKLADIKGQWLIEEEDRFYCVVLGKSGNGPYNWQNGKITTESFNGHNWIGKWSQAGNDREGGFEIALNEDGKTARGKWWYERVDTRKVGARQYGGTYDWSRMDMGAKCAKGAKATKPGKK